MSDLSIIKQLIKLLQESDVDAIELKKGWFSTTVRVSKQGSGGRGDPQHVVVRGTGGSSAPASPEHVAGAGADELAVPEVAPPAQLLEIKSPMVGTFYRAPEPGAEPYVNTGSRIQVGQVVCIIEAMKIMNEIDSDMAGVVREVLPEDTQPVEFGQVLFRVDPNG